MKSVFEHVEYVKSQPHHVRKRVVFGIAGGVTGLIALVWLVGNLSMGLFAIQGSNFADAMAGGSGAVTTSGGSDTSALAGAAAALSSDGENVPAYIQIVDTTPKATTTKKAEQTIIPF